MTRTDDAARAEEMRTKGDPAGARALLQEALGRTRDGPEKGKVLLVLARALLDQGDAAEAARNLEKAAKLVAGTPVLEAEVELDLARVRRRQADLEGALRSLAQAADRFRTAGRPDGERWALAQRGFLLSEIGEHAPARAALRSALALEGPKPEAWRLHHALSLAYESDRRKPEAENAARLARESGWNGRPPEPDLAPHDLLERKAPSELATLLAQAPAGDEDVPISDPGPARAGEDADALARSVENLARADCVRLVGLVGALCAEISPQALLEVILDRAIAWTEASRGHVALAQGVELDGSPRIEVHAARAARGETPAEADATSRALVRDAFAKGAWFATDDAARDARLLGVTPEAGAPPRAAACVPLKIRRAALGVLWLEGPGRSKGFGPRERALLEALAHPAALALERSFKAEKLEHAFSETTRAIGDRSGEAFGIVGRAAPTRNLLRLIATAGAHAAPVLIEGETGTGKEVVARAIHGSSPRRDGPFVAESLGSLPETLIEAEVFGSVKGAYTGASDRRGAFERAHGGTLFLDDVDEAPPRVQALLLRVLEAGEVRPLGAPAPRKVDCRVVASSRRDLAQLVRSGEFREDLYFRINVLRIRVPPLRERAEDIPVLAEEFLRGMGRPATALGPKALDALVAHAWPGNVRELKHALERALIIAGDQPIDVPHLGLDGPVAAASTPGLAPLASASKVALGGHALNRRQLLLVEYLRANGVATTREYCELASVSPATAWRDLNDLVEKSLIQAQGHGRSTVYRMA